MTNDRILFFAILAAIIVGAIIVLRLRQHAAARRYLDQVNKENRETQEFVLARLDSIEKLLADTNLSPSDLQQKSDSVFAEMESRNVKGDLTDLIADTRSYLASEIDRRRSV